MAERHGSGVLDTYIDLDLLDPASLPRVPEITAVTIAELHQGVAMAKDYTRNANGFRGMDTMITVIAL